jgi:hypothetical protein
MTAFPALARLGETPEQCKARYGAPTSEMAIPESQSKYLVYEKNGIRIGATFLQGKCGQISFSKLEGGILFNVEQNYLLKANQDNSTWAEGAIIAGTGTMYTRKDAKAKAEYMLSTRALTITLTSWKDAEAAYADSLKTDKLKDF